jgi:hypothetical protein
MSAPVTLDRTDGVAVITMRAPERPNALTLEMAAAMIDACETIYVDGAFWLTAEQSFALAQEGSPAFVPGAFQLATSLIKDEEKITARLRPALGSAGMSITTTCSPAPSGSSAPGMPPTWSPPGSQRSTGYSPSSRPAPAWPTSGAATAPRRS